MNSLHPKLFVSILTVLVLGQSSCSLNRWDDRDEHSLEKPIQPHVEATVETSAVKASIDEDSADDPAFWVSQEDSCKALLFGTNKRGGIHVFDTTGEEIQYLESGLINNVDVKYGLQLGETKIDIAGGSNRTHQTIDIYQIDSDTLTISLLKRFKVTNAIDEIYGFCFAKDFSTNTFYAIANGKNGVVEQWKIEAPEGEIQATLATTRTIPSQPEGMVSDDINGKLFIGEEEAGIWSLPLNPTSDDEPHFIETSAVANNPHLAYDVEGLTLYYLDVTQGYLIASSQGNNSYAVFDREFPHKYLGSFSITDSETIDGAEETDGIDVINIPFGPRFQQGCFAVQDGYNFDANGEKESQNFKLVSWETIAEKLSLSTSSDFHQWK